VISYVCYNNEVLDTIFRLCLVQPRRRGGEGRGGGGFLRRGGEVKYNLLC
jgi:hypothetical protein